MTKTVLAGLVLALLSVPASAEESRSERLVVVVDLFSGRPNPTIFLDEVVSDKMVVQMTLAEACESGKALEPSTPAYPDKLGYRGIRILRQKGQDSYEEIGQAYSKIVRLRGAKACGEARAGEGSDLILEDPDRELEKRFVTAALDRGMIPEKIRERLMKFLSTQ